MYELPKDEFFNFKDRNRRQFIRAVFVTLAYTRNAPLDVLKSNNDFLKIRLSNGFTFNKLLYAE
jgi:hypothetical protein